MINPFFQTVILGYPEALRYTYNTFLYLDYIRLVLVGFTAE